jgi:putative Mn2+ efflux pump MntP
MITYNSKEESAMNLIYLYFISIGLAMDTFSISLTKGFLIEKLEFRDIFKTVFVLGLFQVLMSFIGFKIGKNYLDKTDKFSHFIIFSVLLFLGGKMIYDAWKESKNREELKVRSKFNLLLLGLATSIDDIVVGSSFSFVSNLDIFFVIMTIGVVTSIASLMGIYLGYKTSARTSYKNNFIGGCILIFISLRILF